MLPFPNKPSDDSNQDDDTAGNPLEKEKSQSTPEIIIHNRARQNKDDSAINFTAGSGNKNIMLGTRLKAVSSTPGPFSFDQDHNNRPKPFGPQRKTTSKIAFGPNNSLVNEHKGRPGSYRSQIPTPPHLLISESDRLSTLSPPVHNIPNSIFSRRKIQPLIPQSILDAHNTEKRQEEEMNKTIALISDLIKELQDHPVVRGVYICELSGISPDDTIHLNSNTTDTNQSEDHLDSPRCSDTGQSSHQSFSDSIIHDFPIKKLYYSMSQGSILSKLSDETMMNISNLLKTNLSVSIVDEIPRKFICSDQIVPLKLTNLDEYQYVLRLFRLLLCKACGDYIKINFINQQFIHELFEFYNSPAPEERRLIQDIFSIITEKYSECNKYIYFECFTRISIHLTDQNAFYCIQPALVFLNRFFKANSSACISCHKSGIRTNSHYSILKSTESTNEFHDTDKSCAIPNKLVNFIDIFSQYILTLFSSNFLYQFYAQLSDLCSFFYGIFEEQAPPLALQYLLKHWPETNSQKQSVFITQIGCILQFINTKSWEKFAHSVIQKFSIGLKNQNFRVVVEIINILNNDSYMALFAPFSKNLVDDILPQLLNLKSFWFSDIKNKLSNAIERLKTMETDAYHTAHKETDKNCNVKNSWELIASQVSQIDDTFNLDGFKNHLDNIESQT